MDEQQLALLQGRIEELEEMVGDLSRILNSSRVQIESFEGKLKTLSTAPVVAEWPDGAIVLYDDEVSTRRIYVKVNDTWRYATLT